MLHLASMTLVVDITHWLEEDGSLPTKNPRLRRQALRIARLIEAGGPLKPGEARETLVECTRRPARKRCMGMMWAEKTSDDRIHAFCPACSKDEVVISGWQDTVWADGMMEPMRPDDLPQPSKLH